MLATKSTTTKNQPNKQKKPVWAKRGIIELKPAQGPLVSSAFHLKALITLQPPLPYLQQDQVIWFQEHSMQILTSEPLGLNALSTQPLAQHIPAAFPASAGASSCAGGLPQLPLPLGRLHQPSVKLTCPKILITLAAESSLFLASNKILCTLSSTDQPPSLLFTVFHKPEKKQNPFRKLSVKCVQVSTYAQWLLVFTLRGVSAVSSGPECLGKVSHLS